MKEKKTKPTEKTVEPFVDGCLNLIGAGNDLRVDKAILAYKAGMSIQAAGEFAGYSPAYSKSRLGGMLKGGSKRFDKRIREIEKRLPAFAKSMNNLDLINLAQAQSGAVEKYKDDPELLIKFPQLARQIKQMAGLLDDDAKPQPTVNIKSVEKLQLIMGQDLERAAAGKKDIIEVNTIPESKRIAHKIKVN